MYCPNLSYDSIGFSNSFAKYYGTDSRFKVIPLERTIGTPAYVINNMSPDVDNVIRSVKSGLMEFVAERFPKVFPATDAS